MCYERYLWRRRHQDEESRNLWDDFERTVPVADPAPPDEVTEPERTEAREQVAADR